MKVVIIILVKLLEVLCHSARDPEPFGSDVRQVACAVCLLAERM